MSGPGYALELAAGGVVAGIDEAGRGPLAGPVVAAAVVLGRCSIPAGLDDSKKLARAQRTRLLAALQDTACIGLGAASVREIDRLNILNATLLAMARATRALSRQLGRAPDLALVDGNRAPALLCPARTVVGGDGKCLSIAAASIAAKVVRDRAMTDLATVHPGYGWERNAGYGTAEHRLALTLIGPTPHHRLSFKPLRTQHFVPR